MDGHDVRDVKLRTLREQMGVMMQDSFIFSGTIMDNIRYGKLDATDEEVIAGRQDRARATTSSCAMEKGYMTEVNERGSSLSVGQQAADFLRARAAERPEDSDSRRGDLVHRHTYRDSDSEGAGRAAEGAHRPSSSRTGCPPSATRTASWSCRMVTLPSAARTTS